MRKVDCVRVVLKHCVQCPSQCVVEAGQDHHRVSADNNVTFRLAFQNARGCSRMFSWPLMNAYKRRKGESTKNNPYTPLA